MYVFYETTTITTSLLRTISLLGLSYFGKGSFLLSSRNLKQKRQKQSEREKEMQVEKGQEETNAGKRGWVSGTGIQ